MPSLFLLRELKLQHGARSGIIPLVLSLKRTPKPGLLFCPRSTRWNTTFPTPQEDNMAELAGLPTPRMDWSSTDAPQALKKFKNLCELYFSGPLKDKSEEEQVSYPSDMVWWRRHRAGVHVDANSWRQDETQHILGKVRRVRGAAKQLQASTLQTPHP